MCRHLKASCCRHSRRVLPITHDAQRTLALAQSLILHSTQNWTCCLEHDALLWLNRDTVLCSKRGGIRNVHAAPFTPQPLRYTHARRRVIACPSDAVHFHVFFAQRVATQLYCMCSRRATGFIQRGCLAAPAMPRPQATTAAPFPRSRRTVHGAGVSSHARHKCHTCGVALSACDGHAAAGTLGVVHSMYSRRAIGAPEKGQLNQPRYQASPPPSAPDALDYHVMLSTWGRCPPASSPAPAHCECRPLRPHRSRPRAPRRDPPRAL